MMPAKEMAMEIVKAMDSKKGLDIRLLHTADITVLAEYFVICTASSATHVKTLTEEIDHVMSELGEPPLRREGPSTSPGSCRRSLKTNFLIKVCTDS